MERSQGREQLEEHQRQVVLKHSGKPLPSGGVPTLLPSPSIARLLALGKIISALSFPLTQCGILTGSEEGNDKRDI